MIRIADINKNDVINGQGVCVSVWTQGCPHRCKGCHNPESWSFSGGYEVKENETIEKILQYLVENGVQRNLSILGGEPLCAENLNFTITLLARAKEKYPHIKTFVWTGYRMEDFPREYLENIDVLIDGPFILEERDITLKLRGSKNQRILYNGFDF